MPQVKGAAFAADSIALNARPVAASTRRSDQPIAPVALPAASNMAMILPTCSSLCSAQSEQRSRKVPAGVAGGRAELTSSPSSSSVARKSAGVGQSVYSRYVFGGTLIHKNNKKQ